MNESDLRERFSEAAQNMHVGPAPEARYIHARVLNRITGGYVAAAAGLAAAGLVASFAVFGDWQVGASDPSDSDSYATNPTVDVPRLDCQST